MWKKGMEYRLNKRNKSKSLKEVDKNRKREKRQTKAREKMTTVNE